MQHLQAHGTRFALAGAIIVGAILRLLNLGGKSLWLDEAYNLAVVRSSMAAPWVRLWPPSFEDHHPPLYYLVLGPWVGVGHSEFWLRLLPAIFGIASTPLVYLVAKRLCNREVAIVAAWLAALSPLMIWYSQEARSYSFVAFLGLLATLSAIKLFDRPSVIRVVMFALALTATFYTHYVSVLLLPFQFLLLVAFVASGRSDRGAVAAWIAGIVLAVLAFVPWLMTPEARAFFASARTGAYPGQLLAARLGVAPETVVMAALLTAAVAGPAAAATVYFLAQRRVFERATADARLVNVVLFTIVVVILGALSVVPRGYSVRKQLLVLWPYGLIALAWLWPWQEAHRHKIVAACLVCLTAALINIYAIPKDEWRDAVQQLISARRAGDQVVLLPSYAAFPFEYYNRGALPVVSEDAAVSRFQSGIQRRIWVIRSQEYAAGSDSEVYRALARSGRVVETMAFHRIRLDLFEVGP